MAEVLVGIVVIATIAVVCAGVYFTLRSFRALDRPRVGAKPRHEKSTIAELKHFFEGKQCAACGRAIPPMHAGQLRPGLLNTRTHEALAWDDIPAANLSTTLESHLPICPSCVLAETFRRQHPELVVDRQRTIENPSH